MKATKLSCFLNLAACEVSSARHKPKIGDRCVRPVGDAFRGVRRFAWIDID